MTEGTTSALDRLLESARSGDPNAQCDLGDLLWSGSIDVKSHKAEAIKSYRESAKRDHVDAILTLARIFDYDGDFAPNYQEAFSWYYKAAELGSPFAQYCVGHCYAYGHGVQKNDVEAAKWYRRSALQKAPGFGPAQHALGVCFQWGKGVPQDQEEAVNWFRRAADRGLAEAQYDLANACQLGEGTGRDFEAAAKWYRAAAIQGHRAAQYNFAVCHFRGIGVAQNRVEAVMWYRKAAEKGQSDAWFNLGLCYRDGDGVEIDWPQAFAWLKRAADQGDKEAKETSAALADLMTREEIEHAMQLCQHMSKTIEPKVGQ